MTSARLLDRSVASAFYGGFANLRPVQEAAIEPLLNGQDLVLASGTGSGKTEAVLAPVISNLWRSTVETDELQVLYIAPTKALVNDLEKRLFPPLDRLGLSIGVRHGDRDDLAAGRRPHLLVTTPESLEVMLLRDDSALTTVRVAIIDEVHLLYNTQRGLQLSILLERIRKKTSGELQVIAVSATIGRPSDVRDFLVGSGQEAVFLSFPAHREIDAQIRAVSEEADFCSLISKLISDCPTKLLVFANSRRDCERLASSLYHDPTLRPILFAHYSSLSPEIRVETERKFAESKSAVCIATSTLELGIDIGDIHAVVLWGPPSSVESFLQRIGRGNRRANKTNVVCMIPPDTDNVIEDAVKFISLVVAARQGHLPQRSPFDLFGAIAQQCLGIIASQPGGYTRIADLLSYFSHKDYMDRQTLESILADLAEQGYLQHHGFKNRYGPDQGLHDLLDQKMIYGNFGIGSQNVEVRYESKPLGAVPFANLLRIHPGSVVRFAGKVWQVRNATAESIVLQPSAQSYGVVDFTYAGRKAEGSVFLSQRMWQLLHETEFPDDILERSLREQVIEALARLRGCFSQNDIPYQRSAEGLIYFTFGGYLVNKAIALTTGKASFEVNDLSIRVNSPIDWSSIPTDPGDYHPHFLRLFETSAEQSLFQTLLPRELQVREFLQDWLKDETIPLVLHRLANSQPKHVPIMTNYF